MLNGSISKARPLLVRTAKRLLKIVVLFAVIAQAEESRSQSLPLVKLYSAALYVDDEVAPDSLAYAIADIDNLSIPLTLNQQDEHGNFLQSKLAGYQVIVAGHPVPILSVESSEQTQSKLRIGVYLPASTPIGTGPLFEGVSVEIKRDDQSGVGQVIASGMTQILPTAPNVFVRDGYRFVYTSLVSLNGATGRAGRTKADDPEELYAIPTTPNIFSASQETRVVLFGTGFRNAADVDLNNNPQGYKNVAESYKCIAHYPKFINGIYAGDRMVDLPVEYVGPVADSSIPGLDQIIIILVPELKNSVVDTPIGAWGEVNISLNEVNTGRSTEVVGSPNFRTRIFVK